MGYEGYYLDLSAGTSSARDAGCGICNFFLTLFAKTESGLYEKHEEVQTEKLWTDTELDEMLAESGLEKVAVYSGFDMKEAKKEDEKRFYVVRCPYNK